MGIPVSFWVDLGERTLRAFAQGVLATWTMLQIHVAPGVELPWLFMLQGGGVYAVYTLITGLAGMKIGDSYTASFLPAPEHINTYFQDRRDSK